MQAFKSFYPEHFILKPHAVCTNTDISYWVDLFSVEEGTGVEINCRAFGSNLSVCEKIDKICKPKRVNRSKHRFNQE